MTIARRCFVTGRVQGVFFRASTRQKALELGISGYAKNLPDGRVEVVAVGNEAKVAALIEWLWQGPPTARVVGVETNTVALDEVGDLSSQFLTV